MSKVQAFFESVYVRRLQPKEGAREILSQLKEYFVFHIVTARPNYAKNVTLAWIHQYFDGIFEDVHFANHYSLDGLPITKADICKRIHATLLIDDSLKYAKNCAEANIPVILFGEYPWNRPNAEQQRTLLSLGKDVDRWLVRRVSAWEDVPNILQQRFSCPKPDTMARKAIDIDPSDANRATSFDGPKIDKFKIAAIQMTSTSNKQHNLDRISVLTKKAAALGARIVCLPECCVFMGENRFDVLDAAETIGNDGVPHPNHSLDTLQQIARENSCWLSVGGFPERFDGEKVFNSHILLDNHGNIVEIYRKIHLFDNPMTNLMESMTTGENMPRNPLIC